ncbi:MAG: glycosyltransferase family 4 protein [Faecalibacterium sp.]
MPKILVLSSFPAPYRVAVFSELAKAFELDVFFGLSQDDNRNEKFFSSKSTFGYHLLDVEEDNQYFQKCIKEINRYNVVLGYDWYLPYARKVLRKCIEKNIPYIINCDGAFIPESRKLKTKIKNVVKRYYVTHASLCFASGEHAARYFEFYGANKRTICFHPFSSLHTNDILDRPLSIAEKKTMRENLGLKGRKTVVSVGQFIPRKGFDILLSAWGDLDENSQLLIIGGGIEKQEYERLIQEYGYENVRLVDFVEKDEIFSFYKASDLFVLPTREDVWGLVINEAMAVGLPVISTTRCIAASELIQDGMNGYIVPVENADVLYYRMKQCLESTELFSMGKRNLEKIKRYTIENIAEQHIEDIKKLIEGNTKYCVY